MKLHAGLVWGSIHMATDIVCACLLPIYTPVKTTTEKFFKGLCLRRPDWLHWENPTWLMRFRGNLLPVRSTQSRRKTRQEEFVLTPQHLGTYTTRVSSGGHEDSAPLARNGERGGSNAEGDGAVRAHERGISRTTDVEVAFQKLPSSARVTNLA